PVFDSVPPAMAPIADQLLTFEVQASDPDSGDTVSLQALNAPQGMTFASVAPSPGSRANAVRLQASWTPTPQQAGGTYVITFQATDSRGPTNSASVSITPIAANSAPTAVAGGPYVIDEGTSLTLDAQGSLDPDNDPLTYSWDVNGDGSFGDATGAS